VSVSDLLWAAAFAGLLLSLNARGEIRQRLIVVRPLLPLIAAYFATLLIVFAVDPSLPGAVALVQRVEVVVVPMLIGAVVLTVRTAHVGMAVFVAAALVLGIAFLMPHAATAGLLGVQKNPAGQYLVDAALIALTVFTVKRVRFAVVPILVLGAYATESRGALIGLVAGLVVWCLLRARDPFQAILRGVVLVVLLLAAYLALPAAEQSRIRGDTASTTYNDNLRSSYIADAWAIFTENPVVGVGVANYLSGDPAHNDVTNDPHNIALLEAAEGGALLVSAFVVLQVGALVVVFRRRRRSAWAIPAICVQVAILVHGMVDVYWVRGTPVIGWLLIGLALAPFGPLATSSSKAEADESVSSRVRAES
jgi:hypothetical protein